MAPSQAVSTTAYASSFVAKSSGGTLVSLSGYNSGGAQFIQVFDSKALGADASVPLFLFSVAATSSFFFPFYDGIPFTSGIVVCNSSTGPAKTIGSADCWFTVVLQ